MRASEFITEVVAQTRQGVTENADQAAVSALQKKHGWSTGRTSNGDLYFTWQGRTYVFYGERMRITLSNDYDNSVSVVWGMKPNWQGRGNNEISFAQAVERKLLKFDLSIWQQLDRRQINDNQALQKFKVENERQAREAIAQGLTEAFDKPYELLRWEKGDFGDVDAIARLDDGTFLSIMFNKGFSKDSKEEAWSVEFYRNNSQEVTGEGDQQRVFATVLSAIQTFIKKYTPNRITFSASKEVEQGQNAQSRARLYDSLVQRYARAWGFRAFRADTGNKVIYELSRIKQPVAEVVKMPPTINSSQGMADWAYQDAREKKAASKGSLQGIPSKIYDMGDHLRVFVLDEQGPVLYLALNKFLDGFKSGAVAVEPRGRGKNLAVRVYQAVSDTFDRPIYSDTTQTDASRIGIWQKLMTSLPGRVVGYDQRTQEDLPLTATDQGPAVRGNQPIYTQRTAKDLPKPVTGQTRSRTRLLKLLPNQQDVDENFADGRNPGRKGLSRRVGIPKKATLGKLEKIAGSSTGERRRMAQWQLNMRRGKKK